MAKMIIKQMKQRRYFFALVCSTFISDKLETRKDCLMIGQQIGSLIILPIFVIIFLLDTVGSLNANLLKGFGFLVTPEMQI